MLMVLNDDVFPENLKILRKKRKLTQAKLAQQSGINVHLIKGIENGRLRSQLPSAQYIRLCQTLSIPPSVLNSRKLSDDVPLI